MTLTLMKKRSIRKRQQRREAARVLQLERLETRQLLAGISEPVAGQWAGAFGSDAVPDNVAEVAVGRMVTVDWNAEEDLLSEVGKGFDGVAKLLMSGRLEKDEQTVGYSGICTGALLEGGRHVLTAAHCFSLTTEEGTYDADNVTVVFELPGRTYEMGPINAGLYVHPDWDPTGIAGNDIAVIELPVEAPREANRYDIYRNAGEVGKNGVKAGYGRPGTGADGSANIPSGTKRFGWNKYDASAGPAGASKHSMLFYDFDNGKAENSFFGSHFGLGVFEVNAAPGDSGGPTFIDGQIAGVTSGGIGYSDENENKQRDAGDLVRTDVNNETDSSFGEISIDTRVSAFADWIDEVIGTRIVDDEDAGFTTAGTWEVAQDAQDRGLNGNYRQLSGQSGKAAWSFIDLSDGWYQVSANMLADRIHSDRAEYVISTGGDTVTTYLDQRVGRDGWRQLGLVEVTDGRLDVTVTQAGKGILVADAIRSIPVEDYHVIDDGDDSFSANGWWGRSGLGGYHGDSRYSSYESAEYEFTQLSPGWYEVSVNTPGHPNSTDRARYTIASSAVTIYATLDQRSGTEGWTVLDTINVTEEEDRLHVKVAQAGRGVLRTDALRIHRVAQPHYWTVDDGGEGFSRRGSWKPSGLSGFDGDSRYTYDRNASATYHFEGLKPGWYQVFTNTPGHQYNTDQAIYTLSGGNQTVITGLGQRPGTNGWKELESVYVSGDSLDVAVTQSGQGALRADAIRIRPTAPPTGQIIDDGEPGFKKSGYWMSSGLRGYQGDSLYAVRGSASYAFADLTPGWYRVSGNTPGHYKYSTDEATYTVTSGDQKQVVIVDQRTGTNDWQELTVIEVTGSGLEVKLTQGDRNILRTDAVQVERISEFYEPYEMALNEYLDESAGRNAAARALSMPRAFEVAEAQSETFLDGRAQTRFLEDRQAAQISILKSPTGTAKTVRETAQRPVAKGGADEQTQALPYVACRFEPSERRLSRTRVQARLGAAEAIFERIGRVENEVLEVVVKPLWETS